MKAHLIIIALCILLAVVVLAVSLLSASASISAKNGKSFATRKNIYFDTKMHPDHLFYPALMFQDAVRLQFANDEQKFSLHQKYAKERLDSTLFLIDKNNHQLALSTLSKSQKYMLLYCQQWSKMNDDVRSETLLDFNINKFDNFLRDSEFAIKNIELTDLSVASDLNLQLHSCRDDI